MLSILQAEIGRTLAVSHRETLTMQIHQENTMTKPSQINKQTVLALGALLSMTALADSSIETRRLFVESAVENSAEHTVSLPLHRGTSDGKSVWYVILDASSDTAARQYRVNRSDKLLNAKGTVAVQKVTVTDGVIQFPATVDFSPERIAVPGPAGFPPAAVQPGATGNPGYSPLIELPDGTLLNAPHIANESGQADKVVSVDTSVGRVVYKETEGYANGKEVYYVSTDASDFTAAALEGVTFAPQLNAAPFAGGDGSNSARATLVGFVNGQTGADNPQRQGFSSALLDGLAPLNVLRWTPDQGRYSPLWDVNLAEWTAAAVAKGKNLLQTDVGSAFDLAKSHLITAPGGGAFKASGFIVNCPIISQAD
ncbi:DUF7482 domain-containing protein [Methyloterricola oryzae]|uniref:DUF7482 domain-containing protein n=1 Tax=Methyloterricola oryzae TaxID=1495050 RepID=UPI0011AF12B0|nr:hypothetical protein [Methyloterricola oryzae]